MSRGTGKPSGSSAFPEGWATTTPVTPSEAGEAPGEAVPLFGVGQVHRLEGRCGLRHRLA